MTSCNSFSSFNSYTKILSCSLIPTQTWEIKTIWDDKLGSTTRYDTWYDTKRWDDDRNKESCSNPVKKAHCENITS